MSDTGAPRSHRAAVLAAALLFAAANLRPAIASVSPLLGAIRRSTGLSPLEAGLLTTLPLVCFGMLALVTPRLVHRAGPGVLALGCLLGLTGGIALRSVASDAALFTGTLIVGIAVAIANVLMPGIVKKDFPHRVGLMTGLYTMALSGGAAAAGATSVPLEELFGGSWRLALAFWAVPAAVATLVWLPVRNEGRETGTRPGEGYEGFDRSDKVAWALTIYMGLQSLNFYVVLAWFPTILHDRGTSLVTSGLLLALANLSGIVSSLVTPLVTHRMKDERLAVALSTTALAVGVAGLLLVRRGLDPLWAVLLGLGQGSAVSLALMMMVLRARSSAQATALSGRAQGVGYLMAAAGPILTGAVYGLTGGWTVPLALLLALLAPQLAAGLWAGYGHVARPSGDRTVPVP